MTPPTDTDQGERAALAQRVARLLRHEVGDFLQTVYSTAAILDERLPAGLAQERRLVADLKSRAELCRFELDAAVDLLASPRLKPGRVDLFPLIGGVVAQARRRYPSLTVLLDGEGGLIVSADGQALAGAVTFLLLALCQAARKQVVVRLAREDSRAVCTLERDGYAVARDQLDWLREPFATTQHGLFGLALALTRRATEPCGGSLAILSREDGGPSVQLSFPVADA
jgi:signal transduction histidine kinase